MGMKADHLLAVRIKWLVVSKLAGCLRKHGAGSGVSKCGTGARTDLGKRRSAT